MVKATPKKVQRKKELMERDLFVEVDERLLLRDTPALQAVAAALPEKPYIKPYDILQVLPISEAVIYQWIKTYKFNYTDLGTGSKVPRYAVERKSFLCFLATRVNKIR